MEREALLRSFGNSVKHDPMFPAKGQKNGGTCLSCFLPSSTEIINIVIASCPAPLLALSMLRLYLPTKDPCIRGGKCWKAIGITSTALIPLEDDKSHPPSSSLHGTPSIQGTRPHTLLLLNYLWEECKLLVRVEELPVYREGLTCTAQTIRKPDKCCPVDIPRMLSV